MEPMAYCGLMRQGRRKHDDASGGTAMSRLAGDALLKERANYYINAYNDFIIIKKNCNKQ